MWDRRRLEPCLHRGVVDDVSTMHAKTVHTLRAANNVKAHWVSAGLILQVAALLALSVSVVVIIAAG